MRSFQILLHNLVLDVGPFQLDEDTLTSSLKKYLTFNHISKQTATYEICGKFYFLLNLKEIFPDDDHDYFLYIIF